MSAYGGKIQPTHLSLSKKLLVVYGTQNDL